MFSPVTRPHLLTLMSRCRSVPLTLLIAPAGSGKSVLLNQWQESQFDSRIVRLNIEVRDQNPTVFFRRFLDTIKIQTSFFDITALHIFNQQHELSASSISDALMLALDTIDDELVIVFDDFQFANSPIVYQVMSSLIDQLPDHIHIIISTRHYPEFSLSRLRFGDALLVINSTDLKIDKTELCRMLENSGAPELSDDYLHSVLSITEGWAVGVRMALIAYIRSGKTALDDFTGNIPEMMDYFGYVVLEEFPEEIQNILVRNSVFDIFDSALWSEVLIPDRKITNGSPINRTAYNLFEKIVSQGLFIVPCSENPGFFRYNGLLRDFLSVRLTSLENNANIRELHKLASHAWIKRNRTEQAITHAKQSGDNEFYMKTLSIACEKWMEQGYASKVFEYLSDLTDEELFSNQSLIESMVFSLVLSRRFHQAQYYLDVLADISSPSTIKTVLSPFLEFLSSCLHFFLGDSDSKLIKKIYWNSSFSSQPNIRAISLVIVAYHQLQRGWIEQSVSTAAQAKTVLSHLGLTYFSSYADLIIALCDRYMGRGISAVDTLHSIYQTIKDDTEAPLWVNIATGMAVAHYEQNQLEAAHKMCEQLLPKISHACATEVVSTVYLLLSRLLHIKEPNRDPARLLTKLDRILILGNYPRYRSQIAQEFMRQSLIEGSHHSALQISHNYDLIELYEQGYWQDNTSYNETRERFGLAISYLFQLQGKFDLADNLLSELHRVAIAHKVRARALIAQCNRIVIDFRRGNSETAVSSLKHQIDIYGLEFFCRSVFDEAPRLEDVFAHASDIKIFTPPQIFTSIFSDLFSLPQEAESSQLLVNQLTKKERQIYDLLVSGLSNSKISEQLGIALSTTKWHLKNIYSKLGVANRTSAIVIARKVI
ncbi:hypothetical protein A9Q99_04105 [Gammaproteobacteria bacterium 45_16_T64]|nr:hypothetical protein A9Q99_04105 [Gammaproteobacteria bacterium 45_16_T64]